jgi:serine/threonine protein kinase
MKEVSKVKAYIKKSLHSIIMERHILKHLHHNFITNLYFSFQDKDYLYLVLDYFSGGDLRFYLNKNVQFNENEIKFFVSNIILSLRYLHRNNILHRDIKPENLIFDENGYLNLGDFGISKKMKKNVEIKDRSGTPGYLSPELIQKKKQSFVSDYFSLGIVVYEMIFLKRPFYGKTRHEVANSILHKNIKLKKSNLPKIFYDSPTAEELVDFINHLLKRKSGERLGAKGINEIMDHPWLKDIDWNTMEFKIIDEENIPFVPNPGDNFDYLKVNVKEEEKIELYDSYLNYINRENSLSGFYFNSFSDRKVMSSDSLYSRPICCRNENNQICQSKTVKVKSNTKKSISETRNESNGSNEFTLSEYIYEDDDDYIFNRNSENIYEQNRKRLSYSPGESGNEQDKIKRNRNSVH